jgi:hypothetical protein
MVSKALTMGLRAWQVRSHHSTIMRRATSLTR